MTDNETPKVAHSAPKVGHSTPDEDVEAHINTMKEVAGDEDVEGHSVHPDKIDDAAPADIDLRGMTDQH